MNAKRRKKAMKVLRKLERQRIILVDIIDEQINSMNKHGEENGYSKGKYPAMSQACDKLQEAYDYLSDAIATIREAAE